MKVSIVSRASVLLCGWLFAGLSLSEPVLADPPVAREYYGAKLEPVAHVLHGAGQGKPEDVLAYMNTLQGHDPAIFMDYIRVKDAPGDYVARLRNKLSKMPGVRAVQIGMSFVHKEMSAGQPPEPYSADVANGKYDEQLRQLFEQLKELNVVYYIRIGFECNGKHNGYRPEEYKKAFMRVTHLMRQSGLHAATVWCVFPVLVESAMPFYPGDEWVDWWAVDLFAPKDISESGPLIALAQKHRKPVMIGESTPKGVGVRQGEQSWKLWFEPYFNLIHRSPGIKAFCYINWDWSKYPQWSNWGDARLQENEVVAGLYRKEMESPLYLHSCEPQVFNAAVRGASPGANKRIAP